MNSIIEAIDYLLLYYSGLFGLAVEKAEIEMEYRDQEKYGMTYFIVTIPDTKEKTYTNEEMKCIMQEYLETCILPASQIPPYSVGEEILEALYIDRVQGLKDKFVVEVIYIDNATAFRYVKNARKEGSKYG